MRAATEATVRQHLDAAVVRLGAAGVACPRVDAEWLLAGTMGIGRGQLWLALDRALDAGLAGRFERALTRREAREPLQQILGWEEFRGVRLTVSPDVLVPRPETETLVDAAVALLPAGIAPLVVDVGCGSGCIACAIAHERADARVIAVDRSFAAVALARSNVRALGLEGHVAVAACDVTTALRGGAADLVVCNAPYLPSALVPMLMPEVSRHEPRLALDGGADGLDVVRRVIAEARRLLRPGGGLALETAGGEQARTVAALLVPAGFSAVAVAADLTGRERFVTARSSVGGPGSSARLARATEREDSGRGAERDAEDSCQRSS